MSWLNMDNLNKTLTAVSNMVAPLDEEDERAAFEGKEEVNDLQEISDAFSSMGSFVSSTLSSLDEILPAAPVGLHEERRDRNVQGGGVNNIARYSDPRNHYSHHSEEKDSISDSNLTGHVSFDDINLSPEDQPGIGMYTSLEIQPPNVSKDESFDTISMNSPTSTPKRHVISSVVSVKLLGLMTPMIGHELDDVTNDPVLRKTVSSNLAQYE